MISAIGNLGTANDKNSSGVTVAVTPARTVPVGRLLVAYVGWDSVFSVGDPNNAETTFQVYDTQGNVWTNIGACTDRQGFFATGGWAGIFVTQVTTQLTTADTITVSATHVGNLVAKAVSIEEFDIGGVDVRWAQAANGYGFQESRVSDPLSIGMDMHASREWLELHCLASEGPNTDSFTWDSDWTEITGDGTTGGADDSNIALRGGYRIATEQTTSVDVTNSTSSTRDSSQTICAISPTKVTLFPNTPLLDDFNRADEYPLDGGLWEMTHPAYGSAFARVSGNAAAGAGGSFLDVFWQRCMECYGTLTTYAGEPHLHIAASGDTTIPSMDGHGVAYVILASGQPTVADCVFLGESGNQGSVVRGRSIVWVAGADGVKWGLQRTRELGDYITRFWMDRGSGWEELAAIFVNPGENIAGAPAIADRLTMSRLDDFGGGMISCGSVFLPQIYRRVLGVA